MAIRPEVSLGKISHSRGAVETCCHEDGGMEGLVDDYFTEGNLGKVPEIRCDGTMTREKFSKEVLDQERVVKLIGCGKYVIVFRE